MALLGYRGWHASSLGSMTGSFCTWTSPSKVCSEGAVKDERLRSFTAGIILLYLPALPTSGTW